jgi:hypothetical protein
MYDGNLEIRGEVLSEELEVLGVPLSISQRALYQDVNPRSKTGLHKNLAYIPARSSFIKTEHDYT